MGVQGFDHVGAVVDHIEAATAFFLTWERARGRGPIEGEWMDKVIGLDQVRAELVIVRTPDGSGKLELTKFHTPSDEKGAYPSPANQLGIRMSPSSSMTWTRSSTDCAPAALA